MIICVDQGFPAKIFCVSCLTSIFDLSYPKMKILQQNNQFNLACFDDSYTIQIFFRNDTKRWLNG